MYLQMISSAFLLPDNQVYIFPAFYLSPPSRQECVSSTTKFRINNLFVSSIFILSKDFNQLEIVYFFLLANLSITLSTQSETLVKAVLVLRVLSEDEVILHPFQPAVFDFQRLYYPVQ